MQTKVAAPAAACPRLPPSFVATLARGDVIRFSASSLLLIPGALNVEVFPGLVFDPADGNGIRVLRDVGPTVLLPYKKVRPRVCVPGS